MLGISLRLGISVEASSTHKVRTIIENERQAAKTSAYVRCYKESRTTLLRLSDLQPKTTSCCCQVFSVSGSKKKRSQESVDKDSDNNIL